MATKEDWDEIVVRVRKEPDPLRSPVVGRLYEVAVDDGTRFLSSFRNEFGEDRILDLIYDLLSEKLAEILNAETPRAFFCVALRRLAIDWRRRGASKVVESPPDSSRASPSDTTEEDRRAFVLDARNAVDALSERDRGIVVAAALREDREAIAREFGTSRANVDQIVSRLQKRFREGDS